MRELTISGIRVRDDGRLQGHYRSFLSQGIPDFRRKPDELQKLIGAITTVVTAAGHRGGWPCSDSRQPS